jgi:hypothetical protein
MTLWDCDTTLCRKGFGVFGFGVECLGREKNVDFRTYRKRTPVGAIECKIWMTKTHQDLVQANAEAVRKALDELAVSQVLEHCP